MAHIDGVARIESELNELQKLSVKMDCELKTQCAILDDLELQNLKPQTFEKRTWSNTSLTSTNPFSKGFIKTNTFPFAFQKKNLAKVAPISNFSTATISLVNQVKNILNEDMYRPQSPQYEPPSALRSSLDESRPRYVP